MSINLHLPENVILKPCITVFGVGGAGCNAVNNMIDSNLEGVKFVVANTDAQALEHSKCNNRIQLGETITRGLGAGASPEIGRAAAEEAINEINEYLSDSNMVFVTAGMGGGTGTGAAPVIAKAAREQGILTVGVVTKPFHFEGFHRMKIADHGLIELQNFVDTLIVIPNQNLFRIANEKTTFGDAFKMADDVLHDGVRSVTDLMIMPGLINLDFADIRAVMSEMGKAMMGTGEAEGDNRSIVAAEAAISNPLLDHSSMKGAKGVLINITGGADMTLFEVDEAANRIREEVDPDANIIFGSAFNNDLEGKVRVSVVATGIEVIGGKTDNKIKPAPIQAQVQEQLEEISEHSEFTRRNIPSYPNRTPYSAPQEEVATQEAPEEENFVAPRPAQPKIKITQPNFITPEAEPTHRQLKTERRATMEKESQKGGALGLFGRMASSMRNFTKDEAAVEITREEQAETYHSEEERIEERELVTEDMVDIPAFQRKNKP